MFGFLLSLCAAAQTGNIAIVASSNMLSCGHLAANLAFTGFLLRFSHEKLRILRRPGFA